MADSARMAVTRIGCLALLLCGLGVTGCSMDSAGNVHWANAPKDREYTQRTTLWNGHLSREPTVHRGGFGVSPKIDPGKIKVNIPK